MSWKDSFKIPIYASFCVFLTLLIILSIQTHAFASPQTEYYIAQALERYFQLPVDARTLSVSGADALLCRGSVCNYLNPAGLGLSRSSEIGLTFSDRSIGGDDFTNADQIEQSEGRGYIAGAFPLGDSKTPCQNTVLSDLGFLVTKEILTTRLAQHPMVTDARLVTVTLYLNNSLSDTLLHSLMTS
jgi:hypothetical protein